MSDDWVNDPYDEAPVHVLDDDGEPDDAEEERDGSDESATPRD